jgi:oligopeptide transport system substrate-binding protein
MMGRTWFLVVMIAGGLAAAAWAVYGSRLPPADFTFTNDSDIASVDPALISGHPEGRIVLSIFEGLARFTPDTYRGEPGAAARWEISEDGRVYTFHLRNDARWSNGDRVTAHDFQYSIRRLLDPHTASRYSYQAWYIAGGRRYNEGGGALSAGDPVEVELNPSPARPNTVRGQLLFGTLKQVAGTSSRDRVFVVEIAGRTRRFQRAAADDELPTGIEPCRQVLLDFREVGVRVIDDQTLELRLNNPTPYFIDLVAYYPLAPVHRGCLEKHGAPAWTRPENIVTNGPYRLTERRIRDRVRLVRNERYWDRDNVRLEVVDALSIDASTTAFNLYETGMIDWVTRPPVEVVRELRKREPPRNDLNPAPMLATYYYMLNTTRNPLDDRRVRNALSLAIDRKQITEVATGAGEIPARSLVPPYLDGYEPQMCAASDADRARELLAEAGYPGGRGFPRLEIHYNTDQQHQAVAELVRKQWQRELGINVSLRNEEWGSYLDTQQQMKYTVSRRIWAGDYLDPNTFLDMYVTNGDNNKTGFSSPKYDRLIADAAQELDEAKRLELLARAERILMDEQPIIPLFYYASRNMVRPQVRGFYNNLQDDHPLRAIWIDPSVEAEAPQPNEFMEPVRD